MNKKNIFNIFIIIFTIVSIALYIFYPRNVKFTYALEIDAHKYISKCNCISYCSEYKDIEHCLHNSLNDLNNPREKIVGYSKSYLKEIATNLNFNNYDYIITYKQQLDKLSYSPYLTLTEDALYLINSKCPLIPTFKETKSNKVYFYAVRKNNKFRILGP